MKKLVLLFALSALTLAGCSSDANHETIASPQPNNAIPDGTITISTDYIDMRMMRVIIGNNGSGISVDTNPHHSAIDVGTLDIKLSDYNAQNGYEIRVTTKDFGNQTPVGKIRLSGNNIGGRQEFTFNGTQEIDIRLPISGL
jgi:hypothetical protein